MKPGLPLKATSAVLAVIGLVGFVLAIWTAPMTSSFTLAGHLAATASLAGFTGVMLAIFAWVQ